MTFIELVFTKSESLIIKQAARLLTVLPVLYL